LRACAELDEQRRSAPIEVSDEITLVAVSKTHPAASIEAANC
jgi:uncharacterized pyridoxal phosphate-containing UPF0001 family protein